MKFIPAIDLKENRCVRLQKGLEEKVTVFNEDPIEQAKYFESMGCQRIHIVDLDAAFGRANINKKTIIRIRKETNLKIELGGGIKNLEDFSFWIKEGINFLILGSLAIKDKNLVVSIVEKYHEKIYIALDVLEDNVMINGWVNNSKIKTDEVISFYNSFPIKGYILTDISRDGMLEGLDLDLIKNNIKKTKKEIIVGGGLSNYKDLYNLKKINSSNLEGVIAGKSFYSGNIKIDKALNIIEKNA